MVDTTGKVVSLDAFRALAAQGSRPPAAPSSIPLDMGEPVIAKSKEGALCALTPEEFRQLTGFQSRATDSGVFKDYLISSRAGKISRMGFKRSSLEPEHMSVEKRSNEDGVFFVFKKYQQTPLIIKDFASVMSQLENALADLMRARVLAVVPETTGPSVDAPQGPTYEPWVPE